MRILFITDSQAKAKNPSRRLDQFPLAILRKFVELSNVIPAANIDAVVHGGDFFDLPRVAPEFCGRIAEIIRFTDVPWYVVPGNHDIYGYTANTIDQTMLGLLAKTNVINILRRGQPALLTDMTQGFSVSLQGQEYYGEIDKGNPEDYDVVYDSASKYHVLAAHGMLLDRPFHTQVAQTLIQDVQSKADVILAGHYHPGWDPVKHNDTLFINPGSMGRVEAGVGDDRIPQFAIIEFTVTGIKYQLFPFKSAQPAANVLDFAGKKDAKLHDALLQNFKQTLQQQTVFSHTIDIPTALNMVASDPANNIDPALVQVALAEVAKVQQSADDAIPKLDGFVESPTRVHITNVQGENFQSHANLDIDFVNGLNIIKGESNSGKTAILRLIKWVLFNEPKGADIISNWANHVKGIVTLSNGYKIERYRTRKSGGHYILTDPYGQSQKFEGFGNDIPPEIINAHQMPPIFITKDEKRNIAFAAQLEQSFLVTETPGFRAAAIGRLTGVQHVDATIRVLNAENKGISKEISIKEKLVDADVVKLKAFETLPQEKAIIDQFQLLIDGAQQYEKEVATLTTLNTKLTALDSQITDTERAIASYANMPTAEEIAEAEKEAQVCDKLETLWRTLVKTNAEILDTQSKLTGLKPILSADNDIKIAEEALAEVTKLTDIKTRLQNIDKEIANTQAELAKVNQVIKIGPHLQEADDLLKELNVVYELKNKFTNVNSDIMDVSYQMEAVEKRIADIEKEMGDMLGGDLCECPTCGQAVNKELLLGGGHHVSV